MLQTPELRVITKETPFQILPGSVVSESVVGLAINQILLIKPKDIVSQIVLSYASNDIAADAQEISELIKSYVPELSFIEFADFHRDLIHTDLKEVLPLLAESYGWNPNEHFWNSVQATFSFPPTFKYWLAEKKVHFSELSPIFLIRGESVEMQNLFWKLVGPISELSLNKNFGIKIIELLCELILMGEMESNLSPQFRPVIAEKWYEQLKTLRYPQTLLLEKNLREKWLTLPWPKSFNAKFIRQNDKTGIEFRVFISQEEDLKKYLTGLQMVHRELQK